jgi:hypothetical protein
MLYIIFASRYISRLQPLLGIVIYLTLPKLPKRRACAALAFDDTMVSVEAAEVRVPPGSECSNQRRGR